MGDLVCKRLVIFACLIVLMLACYQHSEGQRLGRQPKQLLRVVNRNGRIGFIDKTGKIVIAFDKLPKATLYVGDFHEGLAAIFVN